MSRPGGGRSRWLVVAAAVLWSSGGFFAKAPFFDDWPIESRGPLLAFWRASWASVVLLPFVRRPSWSWRLLPMMAAFVAMNWTYLSALSYGEAANAIWLQSTAPVWVFLVSVFGLRERIYARDWLLLAFCVAGLALILVFELRGEKPEAFFMGLLSGMFYAGVVMSLRHLREFDSFWLVALNHSAAVIVFAPIAATNVQYWPHGIQWPLLIGFGALQMGLPYVLFARGLKAMPSHEASGIGLLEPVLLPVWVFLAWRHADNYSPPQWWTMVGGAFILVGLLVRFAGEVRRGRANVTSLHDDAKRETEDRHEQ